MQYENDLDEKLSILIIPPEKISHLDFKQQEYLTEVFKNTYELEVTVKTLFESIHSKLGLKDDTSNMTAEVFNENEEYFYEMIFLFHGSKDEPNEIANMIQRKEDKIRGNVAIIKTKLDPLSHSMKMVPIEKREMIDIMEKRGRPLTVLWKDDEFSEDRIADLEIYGKTFFGDEYVDVKKIHVLDFELELRYVKNEYSEKPIAELLDEKIDSLMVISYGLNDFRDDILLEDFKKILYLAKLGKLTIDKDLTEKKKDEYGRNIIYTKNRLLNLMYNKYHEKL